LRLTVSVYEKGQAIYPKANLKKSTANFPSPIRTIFELFNLIVLLPQSSSQQFSYFMDSVTSLRSWAG